MDRKTQAAFEHLQAREAAMREREEEFQKMVCLSFNRRCRGVVSSGAWAPAPLAIMPWHSQLSQCVHCVVSAPTHTQKEGWDKMTAVASGADARLAAALADLAASQKLCKKVTGQVKDKDVRIKALEAEVEASKAAAGAHGACTRHHCTRKGCDLVWPRLARGWCAYWPYLTVRCKHVCCAGSILLQ